MEEVGKTERMFVTIDLKTFEKKKMRHTGGYFCDHK